MDPRQLILAALAEDIGSGDITSHTTIPEDLRATAQIIAKQSGTIGEDELTREQKDLQKTVDEYIMSVDELGQKKEQELMTV